MNCNGHFKPFDSPKRRAPRQRSRRKSNGEYGLAQRSIQTLDDDVEQYIGNDIINIDAGDNFKQQWGVDSYRDSTIREADNATMTFKSQTRPDTSIQSDAVCRNHDASSGKRKAGGDRSASTVIDLQRTAIKNVPTLLGANPYHLHGSSQLHAGNAEPNLDDEQDIDEQIVTLKQCIKAFRLVYGKDFENLPDPDYSNYNIEHISSTSNLPRAIPKAGFRTQNRRSLQHATALSGSAAPINRMLEPRVHRRIEVQANHGLLRNQTRVRTTEVLTEDPYHGKSPFSRSQIYSLGEQRMLREQNGRKVLRSADRCSHDRAEEAEQNDLERQLVLQQLKRKVFPGETEWTIAGILTDDTGLPNGNFYRVREDNEKWKKLAKRQAILRQM